MGTKKIILTLLGVIAAGFLIVYGLNYFEESSDKGNREQLIKDLKIAAKNAQTFYIHTDEMGFSDRSFLGWDVPENYKNYPKGSMFAHVKDQEVVIVGTVKETGKNGISNVRIDAYVLPDSISIKILN